MPVGSMGNLVSASEHFNTHKYQCKNCGDQVTQYVKKPPFQQRVLYTKPRKNDGFVPRALCSKCVAIAWVQKSR